MAFVQAINAATASGSVTSITTAGITTTSGNLLVLVGAVGSVTINTPTDSKGNTWTPHPNNPQANGGADIKASSWYAKNITGGAGHTFTLNLTGGDFPSMVVLELSGRHTVSPVDVTDHGGDSSQVTSHTLGSLVTTVAGDDLVFVSADSLPSGTASYTAGTGWTVPTNGFNPNTNNYACTVTEYQANKAIGTYAGTLTTGAASELAALLWAFKPAGGAVVAQPRQTLLGVGH